MDAAARATGKCSGFRSRRERARARLHFEKKGATFEEQADLHCFSRRLWAADWRARIAGLLRKPEKVRSGE